MLVLGASHDPNWLASLADAFASSDFVFLPAPSLAAAHRNMDEASFHYAVVDEVLEDGPGALLVAALALDHPEVRVLAMVDDPEGPDRERLTRLGVLNVLGRGHPAADVVEHLRRNWEEGYEPDLTDFAPVTPEELAVFRELLAESPGEPLRQWLAGFALYRCAHYPEALPLLERAAEHRPRRPRWLYYLASCHYRMGNQTEAILAWTHVLRVDVEGRYSQRAREHVGRIDPLR